jgi:hypothetical protein
MCRPMTNGAARVILNLSAPKGQAVNKGIGKSEFPASMSNTRHWVEILN